MNFFDAMKVTGSGLSAQRVRLNVVSSNIANADSTRSPEGGPYRRRDVILGLAAPTFGEELSMLLAGPEVLGIQADLEPPRQVFRPGHPDADPDGYVKLPNVNVVQEMADMITSSRSFEANASVLGTLKAMALKALRIGRE